MEIKVGDRFMTNKGGDVVVVAYTSLDVTYGSRCYSIKRL